MADRGIDPHSATTDAHPERLRQLFRGCSVETSCSAPAVGEAVKASLPAGTAVYITFLPKDSLEQRIRAAAKLREAGLTPVPHLAARHMASTDQLDMCLHRLVSEAMVDRLLLIGGDADRPAGTFTSSLDLIETGLIEKHRIRSVGIAAYPEDHPRISRGTLEAALMTKIARLQQRGISPFIVTQFAFESAPILRWLAWAHDHIDNIPICIGLPGPANVATLLKYAARCGVGNSMRALWRDTYWARVLVQASPEHVIQELAQHDVSREIAGLHFFTFGGMPKTAAWISAVLAGTIEGRSLETGHS